VPTIRRRRPRPLRQHLLGLITGGDHPTDLTLGAAYTQVNVVQADAEDGGRTMLPTIA
jgi:hypothetical protein